MIRNELVEQDEAPRSRGVEVDETLVSGKIRNAERRKRDALGWDKRRGTSSGRRWCSTRPSGSELQGYSNEYCWRWNLRDDGGAMFKTLLQRAATR